MLVFGHFFALLVGVSIPVFQYFLSDLFDAFGPLMSKDEQMQKVELTVRILAVLVLAHGSLHTFTRVFWHHLLSASPEGSNNSTWPRLLTKSVLGLIRSTTLSSRLRLVARQKLSKEVQEIKLEMFQLRWAQSSLVSLLLLSEAGQSRFVSLAQHHWSLCVPLLIRKLLAVTQLKAWWHTVRAPGMLNRRCQRSVSLLHLGRRKLR